MSETKLPLEVGQEVIVRGEYRGGAFNRKYAWVQVPGMAEPISVRTECLQRAEQPKDFAPNIPEMSVERERMLATLAVSMAALVPKDVDPASWLVDTGHAHNALNDLDVFTGTVIRDAERYWSDLVEARDFHCRRANEARAELNRLKQALRAPSITASDVETWRKHTMRPDEVLGFAGEIPITGRFLLNALAELTDNA